MVARADRSTQPALPTAAIVLAAVLFGTTAWFGRVLQDAGLAPPAIAFFRFALIALALAPFATLSRAGLPAAAWAFGGGMAMGVGWTAWVAALTVLPVAESGVLFMTYPLFTIAIAVLVFRERATVGAILGGLLVIGAALVATPVTGHGANPVAVLLALGAPLAYGFLINILARKVAGLTPLTVVAAVAAGAAVAVLPLLASVPASALLPTNAGTLALVVLFAVSTALGPQLLFVHFVPKVGAVRTAMAAAVELPTMIAVGALAFAEPVGFRHVVAAAMVFAAIAVTSGGASRVPPYGAER